MMVSCDGRIQRVLLSGLYCLDRPSGMSTGTDNVDMTSLTAMHVGYPPCLARPTDGDNDDVDDDGIASAAAWRLDDDRWRR